LPSEPASDASPIPLPEITRSVILFCVPSMFDSLGVQVRAPG
jgi:hypothetical protein